MTDAPPPAPTKKKTRYLAIAVLVLAILVAMTLMVLRLFLARSYKVPSGSMIPTISAGEHVLVSKIDKAPGRGKIVVFRYPEHPDQEFVKRIVGLPGDTVEVRGTDVVLNGKPLASCSVGTWAYDEAEGGGHHEGELLVETLDGARYLVFHDRAALSPSTQGPWTVKAGEVFVMGDNRENSHDSRMWFGGAGGGLPVGLIEGTVRPQGVVGLPTGAEALKKKLNACVSGT